MRVLSCVRICESHSKFFLQLIALSVTLDEYFAYSVNIIFGTISNSRMFDITILLFSNLHLLLLIREFCVALEQGFMMF